MFGIASFAGAPFASLAEQTVVVALTGVQASGAVGTVTNGGISVALTGVQADGSVGIAVANISVADARTLTIQPWEKTCCNPLNVQLLQEILG